MSISESSTQTVAERRAAEADLRTLIYKISPSQARLISAVRRCLQKRLPTAFELAYEYRDWIVISYAPGEKGYEGVLAIRASADGVKLYLSGGKELPDPEKLLKGTGKQMRWMPVEQASTLTRPEVVSLIDNALALSNSPFASSGRGSLILRLAK